MSGGEACRQIEESAWAESPVPESATRRRRSSVDTMPTSDSDPFRGVRSARPDWAVDLGETMLSMTTFDLWSAIEQGEVAPWVRVWREGLECWTPVGELPELRWAVECAPREESLEVVPEPPPADAESGPIAQPAMTPAPVGEPRPIAADLPARAVSRQRSQTSLTEETPAPLTQAPAALDPAPREGTRWLVAGSAVAVIAIAAAMFRVTLPAAITHAASPAALAPAALAGAAAPVEAQASPIETSPAAEPSFAEPPEPGATPVVRREERGQRRQPRGGRRAQGR